MSCVCQLLNKRIYDDDDDDDDDDVLRQDGPIYHAVTNRKLTNNDNTPSCRFLYT